MMEAALHHGGALDAALARWGGVRAGWLDLSTGINPHPLALPPLPVAAWARLPERADEQRLQDAARCFYKAGGAIVAAPGTQALINLWPWLFAPARAAILAPTYGEHGKALVAAGHAVAECDGLAAVPPDARLVVAVNPNNPDGRLLSRPALLAMAAALAERDGLLVVDEAFADAEPTASLAPDTGGELPVLVLKSFGKYFGYAGLRLGFALCNEALAERLSGRLGPWAVSGPALAIGTQVLQAEAETGQVRRRLAAQARLTRYALDKGGLSVVGGTAMFTLVRQADAHALFARLAGRHILTRPFAYDRTWLRFGNVQDESEAARLVDALCC